MRIDRFFNATVAANASVTVTRLTLSDGLLTVASGTANAGRTLSVPGPILSKYLKNWTATFHLIAQTTNGLSASPINNRIVCRRLNPSQTAVSVTDLTNELTLRQQPTIESSPNGALRAGVIAVGEAGVIGIPWPTPESLVATAAGASGVSAAGGTLTEAFSGQPVRTIGSNGLQLLGPDCVFDFHFEGGATATNGLAQVWMSIVGEPVAPI